jgi:hypothetical protein
VTEAECRTLVRERSGGMCEARVKDVCKGPGMSMHHRNKAGQGGAWTPANILHLCGDGTTGCHGWIEANPASSRRKGLWLYRGQNPASSPALIVFRGMTGTYLLDDEGSITWLSSRALQRMS